ncbi:hypothetical protein ACFPFV_12715 [Salinicoccus siamensis]
MKHNSGARPLKRFIQRHIETTARKKTHCSRLERRTSCQDRLRR